MMIKRDYIDNLNRKLSQFPCVTVLGPRQCGKTTLVRTEFPNWTYVDFEKPSDFSPFEKDPEDRLSRLQDRIILDEAQLLPALFPILRSRIDAHRSKKGQFILLGSASPALIQRISESLAGRTAFLEMTPLRWSEIHRNNLSIHDLWFRGGFPDAFLASTESAVVEWMEAYTKTYIERDLAVLGIDVSAPLMRRLWTMLAHHHGGLWNASQFGAALGVNYHTVNRYTDILEQTFLIRKLSPYFRNVGKRLVKSPKIYLRDSGLLHYFLGIHSRSVLDTHPARGKSWEGFLMEHVISAFVSRVPGTEAFFWRTSAGAEVDLLMTRGDRPIPFEIKLHTSPSLNDLRGLRSCLQDLKLDRGYVLYPGQTEYSLGENIMALPAENLLANPAKVLEL